MVSVDVEQRATIAVAVAAAATATRIRHDKILAVVFFFSLLFFSLPDAGDSLTELSQLFSLEHFQTSRSSVQSRQPDRADPDPRRRTNITNGAHRIGDPAVGSGGVLGGIGGQKDGSPFVSHDRYNPESPVASHLQGGDVCPSHRL